MPDGIDYLWILVYILIFCLLAYLSYWFAKVRTQYAKVLGSSLVVNKIFTSLIIVPIFIGLAILGFAAAQEDAWLVLAVASLIGLVCPPFLSLVAFLFLSAAMDLSSKYMLAFTALMFGIQFLGVLFTMMDVRDVLDIRLRMEGHQSLIGKAKPSILKGSVCAFFCFPWFLFTIRRHKKRGEIKFKYDFSTSEMGGDMYLTRWTEETITFEYDLEDLVKLSLKNPTTGEPPVREMDRKGKELFKVEIVACLEGPSIKLRTRFEPLQFRRAVLTGSFENALEAELSAKFTVKWSVVLIVLVDHDTGNVTIWRRCDLSSELQMDVTTAFTLKHVSEGLSMPRIANYGKRLVVQGYEPPDFLMLFGN